MPHPVHSLVIPPFDGACARIDRPEPVVARWIACVVDRLLRHVPAHRGLGPMIERVMRFCGVGVLSSLAYALAVAIFTSGLHVGPRTSAILGYGLAVPFNFLLHRHFTFRSMGGMRGDLARYGWTQAVGLSVSYGAMAVCVDLLGLPYGFGIFGALVIVPLVSYLLMDRWVFAKPS